MAQAGRFPQIRDLFAPQLRAMVSAEALQVGWAAELGRCGPVSSVGARVSEPARAGVVEVKVPVTCERGELTLVVSVDEARWLAGLQLAPARRPSPPGRGSRRPTRAQRSSMSRTSRWAPARLRCLAR